MKKYSIGMSLLLAFIITFCLFGIWVISVMNLPLRLIPVRILHVFSVIFPVLFFLVFCALMRKWKFFCTFLLGYILFPVCITLCGLILSNIKETRKERRLQSYTCSSNEFKSWGRCYSCADNLSYSATEEECAKCPNREMKNGICVLKTCPEEYPVRDVRGLSCFTCHYHNMSHVGEEDCNKCSAYQFFDGKCIPRTGLGHRVDEKGRWEIPYVNGKEHGIVKVFYPDNMLKYIMSYKWGKQEGEQLYYNAKGEQIYVLPYKDGKMHGKYVYFPRAEGKTAIRFGVKQEVDFVDDKREGLAVIYYDNEKIRQETQWHNDKEHGYDRLYNEDGKLLMEAFFEDGVMTKASCWTSAGEKRDLTDYQLKQYAAGWAVEVCDE